MYIKKLKLNKKITKAFDDSFDDRDLDIISRRLRGETLQLIGDHLDVTKERVRQVYSGIKENILLNREKFYNAAEPCIHQKIQKTTESDLFISGLINLLTGENVYGFISGYTMPFERTDGVEILLKSIKHSISHSGVSISSPFDGIKYKDYDNLVLSYLNSSGDGGEFFSNFSDDGELFSWSPSKKRPLANRILKMLSLCPKGFGVSANLCYDKIKTSNDGKYSFNLTFDQFALLLINGNAYKKSKLWPVIYDKRKNVLRSSRYISKKDVMSKGELAIEKTIRSFNGTCSASDISKEFERQGLARITTFVTLSKTPIVNKIKRDTYKVIDLVRL